MRIWGNSRIYYESVKFLKPLSISLYDPPWTIFDIFSVLKSYFFSDYWSNYYSLCKKISLFFNVKKCYLTRSGREAIRLALFILNVQPGDEVLVPEYACASLLEPIFSFNAIPKIFGVTDNLQIDFDTFYSLISRKTKVIIIPHIYGQPEDMVKVKHIAIKYNIKVVDDVAQAVGVKFKDRLLGTFGDVGILSFGVLKPIYGIGGGALITNIDSSQLKDFFSFFVPCHPENILISLFKKIVKLKLRRYHFKFLIYYLMTNKRGNVLHLSENKSTLFEPIDKFQLAFANRMFDKFLRDSISFLRKKNKILKLLSGKTDIRFLPINYCNYFRKIPLVVNLKKFGNLDNFLSFCLQNGIEVEPGYLPLSLCLRKESSKTSLKLYNQIVHFPVPPFDIPKSYEYFLEKILK